VIANKGLSASLLGVAFLACAGVAHADGTSEQTIAQTLFDQGVKLMEQGRFSEACPKLAESQRLDPGGGTLLNLGFCRQNEGKLASAWAAYNEALSQAIKDGRKDRENTARVHVDELEGKYARLSIDVSEGARQTNQIEIRIDGTSLRQAAWDVLAPIDRGQHTIVVTAPGKKEFHTSVTIDNDGAVQHVAVPALEDAPVVVPRHDVIPESRGFKGQRTIGTVLLIGGAVVLAGGVATGIVATVVYNQGNPYCDASNNCTNQKAIDYDHQANAFAWAADFAIPVGAVAALAGTIFVLTAPKARTHVVPVASAHGAGLSLVGSF
jgi:Tfp pilus assembly protein PilF